jgi:hypothetical protein
LTPHGNTWNAEKQDIKDRTDEVHPELAIGRGSIHSALHELPAARMSGIFGEFFVVRY